MLMRYLKSAKLPAPPPPARDVYAGSVFASTTQRLEMEPVDRLLEPFDGYTELNIFDFDGTLFRSPCPNPNVRSIKLISIKRRWASLQLRPPPL